ncbi:alkaline phosphatase-like isoform X1 [Macrosteles quadrilineatus]|uniref:alkaline phosphatase-like isoform X1 n=2 Tax=Macrosteles quadrilineatus TaxID=74068 RepID=UPI0023E18B11|nr:alkaline phosphatase-like isoform X1 [Macrosteles quadrilineatus]
MRHQLALSLVAQLVCIVTTIEDQEFWFQKGQRELDEALKTQRNEGVAKNVLLFVGDGMGPNTITAARIYKSLENSSLVFENFPHIGLIKTYCVDKQVPDSASTATAIFSGVKNNFETVGVSAAVTLDDCKSSLDPKHRLSTIVDWAQAAGKSTGFVTTTRVTHATPSALYAHCPNRKWECDTKMPSSASDCKDIARQLVEDEPGKNLKVIMGGGRQCLMTNSSVTPQDPRDTWACSRGDNRDLVQTWVKHKQQLGLSHSYLTNTDDLTRLDPNNVDYVLGLFANGHMKMDYERDKTSAGMPSLTQMTETALKVLLKSEKGFLLVVEGGMIDYSHHRGRARAALDETVALESAVQASLDLLAERGVLLDTLVIVTSDHSHSLAINGNPPRGNNILGLSQVSKQDGISFTTLLYASGGKDNFQYEVKEGNVSRQDPSSSDTTSFDYAQQAVVLEEEARHDGGDVAIYATGPQAHLFHRVHEQNYIAHVVAYAAKIGKYSNSSSQLLTSVPILLFMSFLSIYK